MKNNQKSHVSTDYMDGINKKGWRNTETNGSSIQTSTVGMPVAHSKDQSKLSINEMMAISN